MSKEEVGMHAMLYNVRGRAVPNFRAVATEVQKVRDFRRGQTKSLRLDRELLKKCNQYIDGITAKRNLFLSDDYAPMRAMFREVFSSASIPITSDSHMYNVIRKMREKLARLAEIRDEMLDRIEKFFCSIAEKIKSITTL